MSKVDLFLTLPVMNAAGSLGFAPEPEGPVDLDRLGAFVTNPVSMQRRSPSRDRHYAPFPGGFLLHTGNPNPGFREVIRRYQARWKHSPLPVIVNLLAEHPETLASMVTQLEGIEGVIGVEVNLPPAVDSQTAVDLAQAAAGELPVIVRLPMERALELAEALAGSGVAALSLGPARGTLPDPQGSPRRGRLYGQALFPQALHTVSLLAQGLLPVIGAGGVYGQAEVEAMLEAGAIAVQLDAVLWRGGW